MDILLIRHGQSLSDAGKYYPHEDQYKDVLTDLGYQQAKITGTFLKSLCSSDSIIITSPLIRARETAKTIVSRLDTSPRLIVLDERRIEIIIHRPTQMSFMEVAERALMYFKELEKEAKKIFFITHSFVIQALIFKSLRLDNPQSVRVDNCGISYFMGDKLITQNMVGHLKSNGFDFMSRY